MDTALPIITFVIGFLAGAAIKQLAYVRNVNQITPLDFKWKVVPFKWFWEKTYGSVAAHDIHKYHEAVEAAKK